jgi:hypothetical protein
VPPAASRLRYTCPRGLHRESEIAYC